MTAFLARLDGRFRDTVAGLWSTFLIWTAELGLAADDNLTAARSWLDRRWTEIQRTPVPRSMAGRHRAAAGSRTWDQDRSARADYEWAMAVKRMAARMEGAHSWRCG